MIVKTAAISDTHLGTTAEKAIRKEFARIRQWDPHIVVLPGDFNGGYWGYRATRTTMKLAREYFPRPIIIVVTLGNHDYWFRGRKFSGDRGIDHTGMYIHRFHKPSMREMEYAYQEILKACKENDIHFLDEDGVLRDSRFPELAIVGHTGWYKHTAPPTNDHLYLPYAIEGDTNRYMYKMAMKRVQEHLDKLTPEDKVKIFVSHFPVINLGDTDKYGKEDRFDLFGGDESLGEHIQREFNPCAFINGHAHQRHEGPLRFESGSEYGKPRAIFLEVNLETDECTVVKEEPK